MDIYNASKLPKFDVGINSAFDFELLHHNHAPRFVARIDSLTEPPSIDNAIEWIDPMPSAAELRDLLREAYDWFLAEEEALNEE